MILDIKNYLASTSVKKIGLDFGVLFFTFTLPLWTNLNTIALIVFFVSSILYLPWKERVINFKNNKQILYVFLFLFLTYVFSLFYTDNISFGLRKVEKTLTLVLIPLFVLTHQKKDFNLKWIFASLGGGLYLAIIVCWAVVFYSIYTNATPWVQLQYFFKWIYSSWNLSRPLGGHPSYLGVLIVLFVAAVSAGSMFKKFRRNRVAIILLFVPLLIFLMQTGSRVSLICLGLIGLIYTIKNISSKSVILFGTLLVILVGLSYQFDFMGRKFDKMTDFKGEFRFERLERWTNILEALSDEKSFLLGVGPGDTRTVYEVAYIEGKHYKALNENYNAHNQYLELLVGAGVVGLFLFVFLFYKFALSTKLQDVSFHFFIIFIIFSYSESILERSQGVFMFSFLYSMLYINYCSTKFFKN